MLPVFVQAQALQNPVFPPTVSGNTYIYSGGTASAANASSISFPSPANGPVYGQSTQTQPIGGGRTVPITVRSRPSPAAVAKAIGGFASKIATPLVVGVALWDLCNELGFGCSGGGGQPLTVTKPDPLVCSTAPCYQWYMIGAANRGPFSSVAQACAANAAWLIDYYAPRLRGPITSGTIGVSSGCLGTLDGNQTYVWNVAHDGIQVPPSPSAQPSTLTELQDAIAAKSGWPDSSAITRVLPEAIAAGNPLPMPTPYEITGPASVPLSPTVTTWPDGSKVTDTPQKNIQYGPNSVTVTETSTKTTTSPEGVTSAVSTTTTNDPLPKPEEAKDSCGLPDTPLCAVDGSGTPTAEELPNDQAEKSLNPVKDFLQNPFDVIPRLPTINWAFALPTACGVVPLPAFAPFVTGVDVCQFQPMFHEIMSVVWMLGALFGAISLFMRSSLAD